MASNPTGFKITDAAAGWNRADFADVFIPLTCFNEGNLWVWGGGGQNSGVLGNNTVVNTSSPVQTISNGTNWRDISVGSLSIGAIKSDGSLWLWGGGGSDGQHGDNTILLRSSPVQTVSGGTSWKQASLGARIAFGIKTDGSLWSWGLNSGGVLGHNNAISRSSPVQVLGSNNWKNVSTESTTETVSAVKTDGTLWTWGSGSYGKLGDQTIIAKSSPVQTISGGTNWKSVSVGGGFVSAIKNDGSLWLWGRNTYGNLGNQSIIFTSSPVQTITSGTTWKNVSSGSFHNSAIKTDGTLWLWGRGTSGGLGDNTAVHKSSPIQTVSGGTNWRTVDAGSARTVAIKTDGTLWAWGINSGLGAGVLGDLTAVDKSSPVQIGVGITTWKIVKTTNNVTAAIRS